MEISSSNHYIGRRSPVLSTKGMVASSSPQASLFGLQMLNSGGSAADAALAAAAGLQVTMPCQTGLGGDVFLLYYDADSCIVHALNGSGRSAKGLSIELLRKQGLAVHLPDEHPHNVTVPGAAAAWSDLHDRFCVLSRQDIVSPAVKLASEGFAVAPITSGLWQGSVSQLLSTRYGEELLIDGRAPLPGELMRIPTLAESLQAWGLEGADPFYRGWIAERIVAAVSDAGGVLCMDDLDMHQGQWTNPLAVEYRGSKIWECPPNGQGLAVLVALRILSQFDLSIEVSRHPGPDRYHLLIECMRIGFAVASKYIADPDHAEIPLEQLLSDEYTEFLANHVGWRKTVSSVNHLDIAIPTSDTVYLCTVDAKGNACSFIGSNYHSFGTGIVPQGCGFSLQNRGAGFSLDPKHANALLPTKRPYNTIIPGLVTNMEGSFKSVFGVMGGFMQPQGHLQVISALLDDKIDPQAALDRPRFRLEASTVARLRDAPIMLEEGLEGVVPDLEKRGHKTAIIRGARRSMFGRGQIIWRQSNGVLWGGSDPRADGCALGIPG